VQNAQGALHALSELWAAVLEWQRLTRSAMDGVLMAEHTALAKLLVDCLASPELGGDGVQVAAAALGRNVDAQGALFSKDPQAFAALFAVHVDLTGRYATALAEGRRSDFDVAYAQTLENGRDLGRFVDRAFFGVRS
jgi:hypothetical protein